MRGRRRRPPAHEVADILQACARQHTDVLLASAFVPAQLEYAHKVRRSCVWGWRSSCGALTHGPNLPLRGALVGPGPPLVNQEASDAPTQPSLVMTRVRTHWPAARRTTTARTLTRWFRGAARGGGHGRNVAAASSCARSKTSPNVWWTLDNGTRSWRPLVARWRVAWAIVRGDTQRSVPRRRGRLTRACRSHGDPGDMHSGHLDARPVRVLGVRQAAAAAGRACVAPTDGRGQPVRDTGPRARV